MQNIAPPPHNNTKYQGTIYDVVEECVYSIFKSHLKACSSNTPTTRPTTIMDIGNNLINVLEVGSPKMQDKMRDSYANFRSPESMKYFDSFYRYAMSR